MKTLVIEDIQLNQRILQGILKKYGKCDVTSNGEQGYNYFIRAHQQKDPYDFIFLDIVLPGMSGIDLLKKIRSVDHSQDPVKIVMATSVADKSSVDQALKSGCNGYLVKPYNPTKIEAVLTKLKVG